MLPRLTHSVLTVVEKAEIDSTGRQVGTVIAVHLMISVRLRVLVDVVAIHGLSSSGAAASSSGTNPCRGIDPTQATKVAWRICAAATAVAIAAPHRIVIT
jgi:hypothetical protein